MSAFLNWLENKDNELFLSITEGKGKDITGDGKANFADVMKARVLASGKSEAEAQKIAEKHHKSKK